MQCLFHLYLLSHPSHLLPVDIYFPNKLPIPILWEPLPASPLVGAVRGGRQPPVTSQGPALASLTPAPNPPPAARAASLCPKHSSAAGVCLSSGRPGDEQAPVKCDRTGKADSVLPAGRRGPGGSVGAGSPSRSHLVARPGNGSSRPPCPRSSFPPGREGIHRPCPLRLLRPAPTGHRSGPAAAGTACRRAQNHRGAWAGGDPGASAGPTLSSAQDIPKNRTMRLRALPERFCGSGSPGLWQERCWYKHTL